MILTCDDLLDADELTTLRGLFSTLDSQPGAESAQGELKQVKHNRQLVLGARSAEIRQLVLGALNRKDWLTFALQPRAVSAPLLNVYGPGMGYGAHTDAHLGHTGQRYFRCDVSATLFLDPPADYDGGELCLLTDEGWRSHKLAAGSALFYPTQFVHRVNPVTRGERRACVLWVESFVREPAKRRLLFELQQVRSWIEQHEPLDAPHRQMLVNACENLQRMWVDT